MRPVLEDKKTYRLCADLEDEVPGCGLEGGYAESDRPTAKPMTTNTTPTITLPAALATASPR